VPLNASSWKAVPLLSAKIPANINFKSCGCKSSLNLYVKVVSECAAIFCVYLVAVRLRTASVFFKSSAPSDHKLPPITRTTMASSSSFLILKRAVVARPFTSLMPSTEASGKETSAVTLSSVSPGAEGEVVSESFSAAFPSSRIGFYASLSKCSPSQIKEAIYLIGAN
jgi:hypothetical protein